MTDYESGDNKRAPSTDESTNRYCPSCGQPVTTIYTAGPGAHHVGPCGCQVGSPFLEDLPTEPSTNQEPEIVATDGGTEKRYVAVDPVDLERGDRVIVQDVASDLHLEGVVTGTMNEAGRVGVTVQEDDGKQSVAWDNTGRTYTRVEEVATDGGEVLPEGPVWLAGNSGGGKRTYHTSPDCVILERAKTVQKKPDPSVLFDDIQPCSFCAGSGALVATDGGKDADTLLRFCPGTDIHTNPDTIRHRTTTIATTTIAFTSLFRVGSDTTPKMRAAATTTTTPTSASWPRLPLSGCMTGRPTSRNVINLTTSGLVTDGGHVRATSTDRTYLRIDGLSAGDIGDDYEDLANVVFDWLHVEHEDELEGAVPIWNEAADPHLMEDPTEPHEHLETALDAADSGDVRFYIRHALQLLEGNVQDAEATEGGEVA